MSRLPSGSSIRQEGGVSLLSLPLFLSTRPWGTVMSRFSTHRAALVPVLALTLAGAAGSLAGAPEKPDGAGGAAEGQDWRPILKRSGDYVRQARRFRIEAVETFDEVLEGGQKVEFSNRRKVALR